MTKHRKAELTRIHGQAGREELQVRYDRAAARAAKTGKTRDIETARWLGNLIETRS